MNTAVANALVEHEPVKMPARQIEPSRPMTPMEMISQAVAAGQPIEVIRELMELSREIKREQAREAFDEAMAAAKSEIPVIAKNREVDFTSSKGRTHYRHEDLAEIARTVNPILGRHGLSYRFRTTSVANEPISVTCIVTHRLGYFEENTLVGPRDDSGNKNSLQQVSSTLTYLQRMTLKAALGLAAGEDDDGKASGQTVEDTTTISEEQAEIIRALAEESETDIPKLCQLWKVDAIPDLTVAQFPKAVAALETKKRRLTK